MKINEILTEVRNIKTQNNFTLYSTLAGASKEYNIGIYSRETGKNEEGTAIFTGTHVDTHRKVFKIIFDENKSIIKFIGGGKRYKYNAYHPKLEDKLEDNVSLVSRYHEALNKKSIRKTDKLRDFVWEKNPTDIVSNGNFGFDAYFTELNRTIENGNITISVSNTLLVDDVQFRAVIEDNHTHRTLDSETGDFEEIKTFIGSYIDNNKLTESKKIKSTSIDEIKELIGKFSKKIKMDDTIENGLREIDGYHTETGRELFYISEKSSKDTINIQFGNTNKNFNLYHPKLLPFIKKHIPLIISAHERNNQLATHNYRILIKEIKKLDTGLTVEEYEGIIDIFPSSATGLTIEIVVDVLVTDSYRVTISEDGENTIIFSGSFTEIQNKIIACIKEHTKNLNENAAYITEVRHLKKASLAKIIDTISDEKLENLVRPYIDLTPGSRLPVIQINYNYGPHSDRKLAHNQVKLLNIVEDRDDFIIIINRKNDFKSKIYKIKRYRYMAEDKVTDFVFHYYHNFNDNVYNIINSISHIKNFFKEHLDSALEIEYSLNHMGFYPLKADRHNILINFDVDEYGVLTYQLIILSNNDHSVEFKSNYSTHNELCNKALKLYNQKL